MFIVVFFVLSCLLSVLQILFSDIPATTALVKGFLVGSVGLQGIFTFMGHYLKSDEIARDIGWPTGSPFQKEIAFANLGVGVAGVLCFFFDSGFHLATICIVTIFLWGAAHTHIMDIRQNENKHKFNAGPMLYYDIILPLILIGLYAANRLA